MVGDLLPFGIKMCDLEAKTYLACNNIGFRIWHPQLCLHPDFRWWISAVLLIWFCIECTLFKDAIYVEGIFLASLFFKYVMSKLRNLIGKGRRVSLGGSLVYFYTWRSLNFSELISTPNLKNISKFLGWCG